MSFAMDVSKFKVKTEAQMDNVIRKIGIEVGTRIIRRTPVDTGLARNNWFTSIGNASDEITDQVDKTGAIATARIIKEARAWKPASGLSLFIVDNLPYIEVLERGRRDNKGSLQAPNGMVGITVAEFQNIVVGSV